jgi:SAM-dependent methyltransferase
MDEELTAPAHRSETSASDALETTPENLDAVLAVMRCPECGGHMLPERPDVACVNGHVLPVVDGYLDATGARAVASAATAKTFESFGYEWTTFSDVLEEDKLYAEHYLRDLDLPRLAGRLGLDAGCGRGRYTRFLAPHLSQLVALDGSDAVRSAAANMADLKNTIVLRSDLRRAPFADESFGFVASYGVLHHLEDPRAGFDFLVGLLAPGGVMTLYLYSRPERRGPRGIGLAAAAWLRRYTVRMPHPALRALCYPLAALLWIGVVLPGKLGDVAHVEKLSSLPMATYRGKPARTLVLDSFDRLSAPVEHRYVWADLAPWFEEAGLVVDAYRDESGWFVVAHRPAD